MTDTSPPAWREGHVLGGGTRFWVRALGHGDDVAVLLHGFPHDGSTFAGVAPLLAARGWRVVAPDGRGIGRSLASDTVLAPDVLADEISQLVRNLHARRVLLVGHDWGGAVALATAFRHPGRVAGVVLVSSPYRQLDLVRAWHVTLANVPVLPELAARVAPRLVARTALRTQTSVPVLHDAATLDAATRVVGGQPEGWLAYFRQLSRRAVRDEAMRRVRRGVPRLADPPSPPRLRVPGHVVWGEQDPVFPVRLGAGVARDLQVGFEVLPGVGHHPQLESPARLADAVHRFAVTHGLAPAMPPDAG